MRFFSPSHVADIAATSSCRAGDSASNMACTHFCTYKCNYLNLATEAYYT